jgi:hypothetical protein
MPAKSAPPTQTVAQAQPVRFTDDRAIATLLRHFAQGAKQERKPTSA